MSGAGARKQKEVPTPEGVAREAGATLVVEAADGLAPLRLDGAPEWPVLVLLDGTPCAWLQLPSPGASGPGLVGEVVVRSAEWLHDRRRLEQSLRRRLSAPVGSHPEPAVSLVVCTSQRPKWVARLLDALGRLEPAPLEVIVVDNDPGGADCEAVALEAGARYVREERRGLDRARCLGVRAARGEVIGFVDDDCEPPPNWLAGLGRAFAQPGVAAVTGPAFPAALQTSQARLFEQVASFNRGLEPHLIDWMSLGPWGAVHAGVGANMFFRRDVLARPEDYFPPELDMGTPTRSGGDTYALYRVMTNGMRIAYEPGIWLFHHHRQDAPAVRGAVRGYGIGLSALAAKLLVEHGELGAVRLWPWFVGEYLKALAARLVGSGDRDLLEVRREYLRGAVAGPAAWRRAKREARAAPPAQVELRPVPEPAEPEPTPRPRQAHPEVSVIVLTSGRRPAVRRCLDRLAGQTIARDRYEVILAVDAEPVSFAIAGGNVDEVVWGGGRGAAASRNAAVARAAGDLLLFLDDDTVPAADLLERHLEAHGGDDRPPGGGRRVVVGHAEPRAAEPTFIAQRVALWWHDHFARKRDAVALTFTDVLTLNLSMPRALWTEVGGLDEDFVWRREDWELGIRLLESGAELVHEPAAVADHELTLSTRDRLAGAFMEGRGDAMLVARWPDTASALPPRRIGRRGWARRRDALSAAILTRSERARRAVAAILSFYERVGARQAWLNLFLVAERATYEAGRRAGEDLAGTPRESALAPLEVDLADDVPVPPPERVPPPVSVRLAGRPIAGVYPIEGQWSASIAEQIALAAGRADLDGFAGGPLVVDEDDPRHPSLSDMVLVLGPLHGESAEYDPAAFESAGGRIEMRTGNRDDHWSLIDAAIREASEPVIAMPMPGVTLGPESLRIARRPLDGERVALALGSGAVPGERRPATRLLQRDPHSELSWMWGEPEQYLVMRRDSYLALGGFDRSTAWAGPFGPVLDLVDRVLQEEWLVARGVVPGVSPPVSEPSARRRAQWSRWYARGALMSRRASGDGGGARWLLAYGIWPLAGKLVGAARGRDPGMRHATGLSAAFGAGAVAQALRRR